MLQYLVYMYLSSFCFDSRKRFFVINACDCRLSSVGKYLLTLCLIVSSADNLCKQFGPRWYSWKTYSKTLILKKKISRRQKSMQNYPVGTVLKCRHYFRSSRQPVRHVSKADPCRQHICSHRSESYSWRPHGQQCDTRCKYTRYSNCPLHGVSVSYFPI